MILCLNNRRFIFFVTLIKRFGLKFVLRKRTLCCSLVLLFLGIMYICLTIFTYSNCSFVEVENAVFTICDKYQNREALGNLCVDLCELSALQPNTCLSNHAGKDVVFQAVYNDNQVVVKSSKLNFDDFDQIYYLNEEGNKIHPSINMFYSMIANTVKVELNVDISHLNNDSLEILTKLWTRNMENFLHLPASVQIAAMNNIWFLIQQTEYLLMKYYEDVNLFPKILGTCGSFYVVEFIDPLDNYFSTFYPSWKETFFKRAELALKVLHFLEETEKHFPFLHFCDVKVGHFGLDQYSDVKLLDMDMVFFETSLIKNVVAIKNCTRNQECSFIDCQASCSIPSGKCEPKILDNNFQRVCRNVLSGRHLQSYFGLLSLPPPAISQELQDLLRKCSELMDDKAAHILASQLKHLLTSVVQEDT